MYTVLLDGAYLYHPNLKDYQISEAKIELAVNTSGSFDFTIYPTNPLYGSLRRLVSVIEVYDDDVLIFRGRPLNDTTALYRNQDIQCEGDLAFLHDSTCLPYAYSGGIQGYLELLVQGHNSQVDDAKQFVVGNVTVTDPNNTIVRSNIDPVSTWDEMSDKLFNSSLGGYLMVRREGTINYLDYLADSTSISSQTIEIGKNILDYQEEVKAKDIVTVLVPYGAKLKDEEGNDTDERLTIADVNGGSVFLEHAAGIAKYNRIIGFQIWDDVTEATNLKNKATTELNFLVNLGFSITVKLLDIGLINSTVPKIRCFQYVRIKSAKHQIDDDFLVKKRTINLTAPENDTIDVGLDISTFSGKQLELASTIKIIQADYVTNQQVAAVVSSIETHISAIEQTAEEVNIGVVNLREYTDGRMDEQSTLITQTDSKITQEIINRQDADSLLSSTIESTATALQIAIANSGGNNLLKNSVMFAGNNYWTVVTAGQTGETNSWALKGLSKMAIVGNGERKQTVSVTAGNEYTLSAKVLKQTEAGSIQLLINGSVVWSKTDIYDGSFAYTFAAINDTLEVDLKVTGATNLMITDLVISLGNQATWTQAAGETYSLLVQMDGTGIKVKDSNGSGYTIMSPYEFARYFDGQQVFTINGDISEVMGLKIKGKGLYIAPIKMVQNGSTSLDIVWIGEDS